MIAPEDMQPGESYVWVYKTWEGKFARQQGKFLRRKIDYGLLWFWFEMTDKEGKTYECPWDYSTFNNTEKLLDHETQPS